MHNRLNGGGLHRGCVREGDEPALFPEEGDPSAYAARCWGSSTSLSSLLQYAGGGSSRAGDTVGLNKLIKKSGSIIGCKWDPFRR